MSSSRSGTSPRRPARTSGWIGRSRRTSSWGRPRQRRRRTARQPARSRSISSGSATTTSATTRLRPATTSPISSMGRSGDGRGPTRGSIDGMTSSTAIDAEPVIRVVGLRKVYGDLVAVDGIGFEVARGEVFGLLGPNGAGKTTTVEVLEGLRKPDGGSVTVLGVDVVQSPGRLKPRIGVSLQNAALYPKLTVTELLDLFGRFYPSARPTDE